jgi:hypothetical protein
MGWTGTRAKDLDDPPDWLVEEELRQREFIAALRRKRAQTALELFSSFASATLSGLGPWRFDDTYSAWRAWWCRFIPASIPPWVF